MARNTPSPERARLVAALRELKQRTGLSLAALADRTPYSKSSWDRYLNGGTLPSRQAVRDLCALAGEPEGRCLALWEIAEAESSGRAATASPAAAPAPADEPRPSAGSGHGTEVPPGGRGNAADRGAVARGGRGSSVTRSGRQGVVAVLAAVGALVVGCGAAALLLPPDRAGSATPPLRAPSASVPVPGPRCRGAACEGGNPLHMRCAASPGSLLTARTATGAWIELRHNERCGAVWARTWGTGIGDRVEVTAGGPTRAAEVVDEIDVESYVYTPMTAVRPGGVVHACFRPAGSGAPECFTQRAE
ncbi:helix-turn-helix domain-containing protein [Streptomyces chilikensis]|uniref:DUF2690 domain-containing protein n=1 Tax=Streptomyces chilikensis TaxID=1194079 RepID=A0ABV3ESV8_9ACTN